MILNSHVYFKGELVRKELFHVGGIRERGGGIGKSVWMKRRRLEDVTLLKKKAKFSSYGVPAGNDIMLIRQICDHAENPPN
jgi:hypothetical protein